VSEASDSELAGLLSQSLGGATVEGLERLSGGASRETWRFDAVGPDGAVRQLILRRDPPQRPGPEGAMRREAEAITASGQAGLAVPEVVVADGDGSQLGSPGMVMGRVAGETIARRILRDDAYAEARARLTRQCGDFLGRLHGLPVDSVEGLATEDAVTAYRGSYAALDQPSATFELAFRWLEDHRPAGTGETIVHGDFRLGNLIVDEDGLAAVLDWELVHKGDPIEDLGWLCTKAWRFGAEPPVAGVGSREELVAAYEAAGGAPVDPTILWWWEVVGTLKWGVICMAQAAVHLSGLHRSVELAAIGRRVCEQEADLLELLVPEPWAKALAETDTSTPAPPPGLHGRPTAVELLDALQGFLDTDVAEATSGRVRFHTKVATRVVAMIAREITFGADQSARYREGLSRLGVADERELARAVAGGELDARHDDLVAFLCRSLADKLAVAHPPA
jgi:aminoglycoside phosphotransferase (APT) family kinase protein